MGKNKLLNIGDKIEIETPEVFSHIKEKNLISQIMDIPEERIIFIATPILNNVTIPIPVGEIIFIRCAQKDLGIYKFKAKVLGRKHIENISYMKIEIIGEPSKVQRRNFFRLDTLLNIQIHIIDHNDENKIVKAFTKDISGGGIRAISQQKISINTKVKVRIEAISSQLVIEGKIVRCLPYQEGSYDLGIAFEDIDEKTRTQIVSFIFQEQRKLRKKGLI